MIAISFLRKEARPVENDRLGLSDVEKKITAMGITKILTIGDVRLLYRMASGLRSGGKILEIGTSHGRSTRVMSMAAPSCIILTIDKVNCWDGPSEKNIIRIIGDSSEIAGRIRTEFDLIFIDGDHTEAGVKRDIQVCVQMLRKGSPLIFHDYIGSHLGVSAAVDAFMSKSGDFKRVWIDPGEESTLCYVAIKQ
jgi:predicted O-methyltransferase YrrM